ncbi:MAG: hypothetical protein EBW81_01315 [Gammaproteobacteria bacterium]|nr:hypothetical protein [Gammaproteobacteria bacterium]
MMSICAKLGRVGFMNTRSFLVVFSMLAVMPAGAESLYRSDMTFISNADRQTEIEKLASIETPSEQQYLTQIALEKPDVFVRQLNRARDILIAGGEPSQVSSRLKTEGFYSPETQSALQAFVLALHPEDSINTSRVMDFVVRMNNPIGVWDYLLQPDVELDDYAALECAPGKAPTELLGPAEHQYVIQVAHPNMELSLWRFDAREAVSYPVATVVETTVESYKLIDRFGSDVGTLSRDDLSMQLPTGDMLQCQKVEPAIMRAYQDHRREMILAEKQL